MSEDSGAEKEFDPTSKRLEELRKKGTVLRAKDFTGGMSLIIAIGILISLSDTILKTMKHNFKAVLSNFDPSMIGSAEVGKLVKQLAYSNVLLLLPLGLGLIVIALVSTYLLGGKLQFSTEVLHFKAERLNPIKNLKNMFAPTKIFELMKSSMKVILFFSFFALFLYTNQLEIINLTTARDSNVFGHGFGVLRDFLIFMIPPIILLSAMDAIYSYFSHKKKTKMTLQEVKDERKETDGSPEVKSKRRAQQVALARRNIQTAVPTASVVITNPTHYAIALKYNEDEDKAPKIVAKGVDHMAKEIKLLALKNVIPVYESPQLARAIYFTGKVGAYIHPDLYRAVAMVLAYIVQLRNYQQGLGDMPDMVVGEVDIPEDMRY